MSFGIKATGGSEGALQVRLDKGLRKEVSGEPINSAGDDAAGFAVAMTTETPLPRNQAADQGAPSTPPTGASPARNLSQLQDADAAAETSKQVAGQLRARAQDAVQAQFNAPKSHVLQLLA